MRLTDASVAIRPRNPWESIDLGVLLAREHRGLLMGSWALVTLPIFCLLSAVFWEYPSIALFVFWWLKPLYDRLPLLILSQALFGNTPSLKEALKAWPRTLKSQWLASLTWRRLGASRSFLLPVQQLEHLNGAPRAQRIGVLSRKDMRAARCLTSVGASLETVLWIGMITLFYAMIPEQIEIDWSWQKLLLAEGQWNWLEHLTNAFYAMVLVFWEPIYVACGFTLYLNRRTQLEAWDIELVLRRLRQRLIGSAYVLLIGAGVALMTISSTSWADEPPEQSCPIPEQSPVKAGQQEAGPMSPRLTHQPVTSQDSARQIGSVLDQPPFKNMKSETRWRWKSPDEARPASEHARQAAPSPWLMRLLNAARTLASTFEVLLWGALLAVVCLLAWRYRSWVGTFVSRRSAKEKLPLRDMPEQLFGLQISSASLPDDVAGHAQQLWANQPREALGLLYRALLNRLLIDYQLPLKEADTEGQVLLRVASLAEPSLTIFSRNLMRHWQNLAYGHQLPPQQACQELCDGWRNLGKPGAPS